MPYRHPPRLESTDPRDVTMFVDARVAQANRELREHFDRRLDEKFAELRQLFESGFPNGDPVLHRAYHAAQIELIKTNKRLKQAVIEKLASGGAWAVVLAMGAALLLWLKTQLGIEDK